MGKEKLILFYADLLGAIMHCISDAEYEICAVAEQANQDLLELVKVSIVFGGGESLCSSTD